MGDGAAMALGSTAASSIRPVICLGPSSFMTTPAPVSMETLLFLGDTSALVRAGGVGALVAAGGVGALATTRGCGCGCCCCGGGGNDAVGLPAPTPAAAPSTWIFPSRCAATAAARKNRDRNAEWPDAAVEMSSPTAEWPPWPPAPALPPPWSCPAPASSLRSAGPSSHWMCGDLLSAVL